MEPTKYISRAAPNVDRQYVNGELQGIEKATGALNDYVVPLAKSVHDFSGQYNSFFNSGYVAFVGPNGTLKFSGQLVFGTNIPNPAGVPNCPGLLIGGADGPVLSMLSTDEQVPGKDGIDLIVVAGSTGVNVGNVQAGGDLLLFGGGALGGLGGNAKLQGGTSFNGTGGTTTVSGSNSTNAGGPRGSVFIQGGENGNGGGNVEVIMTGGTGTNGEIRFKFNSTLLWTILSTGAVVFGAGAQTAGDVLVSAGVSGLPAWTTNDANAAKTATTTRTATTVVSDDPHLAIASVPTGTWQVELFAKFSGSSQGGFKGRLNTGAQTANIGVSGHANGASFSREVIAGNADFTIAALANGDLTNAGANLTTTGNATVTGGGTSWQKVGGGVAFDSAVYLNTNHTNVRIRCTPQTARFLFGLSTAQALHANITRAFFFNNDGNAYIFEAGVQIGASLGGFAGNTYEITYDGTNARYYVNGGLILTTATAGALYPDSSFVDPGAQGTNFVVAVLNGVNQWVSFTGVVEMAAAGAIAFAWAQNTSDVQGTSVEKGFLTLRRM